MRPFWKTLFLVFAILIGNQFLRSPFYLWNWTKSLQLYADGYRDVVYERKTFNLGVSERIGTSDTLVVVFPDVHSAVGFWHPFLTSMSEEPSVRYLDWFGEGISTWKESSIVFTDLDLMLETVLLDHQGSTVIVGQGLGAWLAIRYAHAHPKENISVIAISPDGYQEAGLYPQTLDELRDEQVDYVGEQWLPTFVLEDWLQWLDNPVKLSIHKEMHLESMLEKENTLGDIEFISVKKNSHYSGQVWDSCTKEVGWSCTAKLVTTLEKALIDVDL